MIAPPGVARLSRTWFAAGQDDAVKIALTLQTSIRRPDPGDDGKAAREENHAEMT